MNVAAVVKKVKSGSLKLLDVTEEERHKALHAIAENLLKNQSKILKENQKDLIAAKKNKISAALFDRLTLNEARVQHMAKACLDIAHFPQVVGVFESRQKLKNGLEIKKERVPLGVIAMIFESRPNVTVEALGLAIKSGNAMILKGGKEAIHSNRILFQVVIEAIKTILPKDIFAMLEKREDVLKILKLKNEIDLVVPRGGSALVNFVKDNAAIPVIAHDKGLCHIFIDESADIEIVLPIVINAKTQRPGVCNAMETLLVHKNFPALELKKILNALFEKGVEIKGSVNSLKLDERIKKATPKDFATEHLDLKMSLGIVQSVEEAVTHIQKYGSHHTESILSYDEKNLQYFRNHVDASAVVSNASTRFNDGGELGLGAELGISTNKLHAYGPMGARELTTTRFVIEGSGQIRK